MMRAKMYVTSVAKTGNVEHLTLQPVGNSSYPTDGSSEDNTFALWTPSGKCELAITNPALHGKFAYGDRFYVEFTRADVAVAAPESAPTTAEGAE